MKSIASEPPDSRPDYIVVGGGTAGCLIARQLSERTDASVLLIEAGPQQGDVRTIAPALYPRLFGSRFDWDHRTEPAAGLNGRSLRWPRGKLLGGCSAVNALIYLQSPAATFKQCKLPAPALPAPASPADQRSSCPLSGVQLAPIENLHPWSVQFLDVAQSLGLELNPKMLQATSGECGSYWLTQDSQHRRDHVGLSGAQTGNLQILTGWTAARLSIERDRVVGVRLHGPGGRTAEIHASQEVILTSGALGSPELLLRSGVGPAAELESIGLKCIVDSPQVGKNLQDHLVYPVVYKTSCSAGLPRTFDRAQRHAYRLGQASPLASNIAESGAIMDIEGADGRNVPVQIHCTPTHYLKYPVLPTDDDCMSLGVSPLSPASRGQVRLAEKEGKLQLAIQPAYLQKARDVADFATAVLGVRAKFSPALSVLGWAELLPGRRGDKIKNLHRSIAAYAASIYHPTSTCSMGSTAGSSVVDFDFCIHGLDHVRIADASVFPSIPTSNTQAPTMWIAAECAAKIASA